MGNQASKKNETAPSRPPVTQPKLPGYYDRVKQVQCFAPRPTVTNNFERPRPFSLIKSDQLWRQDLDKYRTGTSGQNSYIARLDKQAEEYRKDCELDKFTLELRRKREIAENAILLETRPLPKPQTLSALFSRTSRLQFLRDNDAKYFPIKKRRPELTDHMLRHIETMKSTPNNSLLTEIDGVQILGKDIRTLIGLNWLNDEIINAYMTLLTYRGKRPGFESVHSFNTFFYPKLRESGYNSVRRWTRKVDVFSFDYIIVPVHLGNHWTLVFIDFKQRTISYYDSLGGYNDGHCDILLDYLRSEMSDKKKQVFSDSGWQLVNRSHDGIPKQQNCSDCGVFACIYAEHLTRQAELDFSQEDMPYYRDRMIYEITTQRILE